MREPLRCLSPCSRAPRAATPKLLPALVVDRPHHPPRLSAVFGSFPTPIEFVEADVLECHSLHSLGAIWTRHIPPQDHLPIFEFAYEVEVSTFVVDPRLLPLSRAGVEN